MQIALVLYPKFTLLDIIGPFQVLVDVPGHDVVFVGAEAGPVTDHTGRCPLVASASFAEVPSPDVVVVPGGNSKDFAGPVAGWLRGVYPSATWVTSVCTGSIFLAAAGLLDGADATTHWAWTEHLEKFGARSARSASSSGERSSRPRACRAESTWRSLCSVTLAAP
jgi:putative intracellular protease/amidase